eukprot:scaffold134404_cov66-Attheya_sp.AAC.3
MLVYYWPLVLGFSIPKIAAVIMSTGYISSATLTSGTKLVEIDGHRKFGISLHCPGGQCIASGW